MNNAAMMMRYDARRKSVLVAYLLWFFLGGPIAAHRMYLGRWISALIYVALSVIGWTLSWILFGWVILIPLGIWWFVDMFLIPGMVVHDNERVIREIEHGH